jgi:predicted dehydrogenase
MLRAGIIGAGAAGRAQARAFAALGDTVRVVGIHDKDGEAALALAGELAAEPFSELGIMLEQVDIVVVASPTELHVEHAVRAIAAGTDVLIERPVALRTPEIVKLQGVIARAPGRPVVQAGHAALFDPMMLTVLRSLGSQAPAIIELNHELPRVSGSSTAEDLLYDAVTVLHPLARGHATAVHAAGRRRRHGGGLEHLSALIATDTGVIATIHVGHMTSEPAQHVVVVTETSRIEGDEQDGWVRITPRAALRDGGPVAAPSAAHTDGEDALVSQARAFLASVTARSTPMVPLAAAVPAVELTEHVLRRVEMGERLGPGGARRAA